MLTRLFGSGRTSGATEKRQPDRVPGRRVRVLPDDQHLDLGQRPAERPQDVVAVRAGSARPAAISARRNSPIGAICSSTGRQRLGPVGGHQPSLDESGRARSCRHPRTAGRVGRDSRSRNADSSASRSAGAARSSRALISAIRSGSATPTAPAMPAAASSPSKSSSVSAAGSRARTNVGDPGVDPHRAGLDGGGDGVARAPPGTPRRAARSRRSASGAASARRRGRTAAAGRTSRRRSSRRRS